MSLMSLTDHQIMAVYAAARRVHDGIQKRARAIDDLVCIGVKKSDTGLCIDIYREMRCGECYTQTLTKAIAEIYLTLIHRDNGSIGLKMALSAPGKV